jgi:uncharacterized protein
MQIAHDPAQGNEINAYEDGKLTIADTVYTSSVLVTATTVIADYQITLNPAQCESLLDHDVDVIIYGTGEKQVFPEAQVGQFFLMRGVGFEVMDTAAACRTFNVLHNEGRRVLALLVV